MHEQQGCARHAPARQPLSRHREAAVARRGSALEVHPVLCVSGGRGVAMLAGLLCSTAPAAGAVAGRGSGERSGRAVTKEEGGVREGRAVFSPVRRRDTQRHQGSAGARQGSQSHYLAAADMGAAAVPPSPAVPAAAPASGSATAADAAAAALAAAGAAGAAALAAAGAAAAATFAAAGAADDAAAAAAAPATATFAAPAAGAAALRCPSAA